MIHLIYGRMSTLGMYNIDVASSWGICQLSEKDLFYPQ